ncbi:hypothetical protein M9458_048904, partial [Cirrhinus mrigala]
AVLVVCHSSEEHQISQDLLPLSSQTPVPQLLGDLIKKGIARKFYLSVIKVEALLDTGADITLMSTELLEEIQERTKKLNGVLKLQRCELNLQAYSHTGLQLKHVAPIHLTVGPMSLIHPVYISPLKTYPLFIGKDLLNRFEPLIDFKHLKMWTQVCEPLPFQSVDSLESQCQTTDTASNVLSDVTRSKPRPSSSSAASSKDQDPFLCSLQAWDSDSGPLQISTAINVQDTSVSDAVLALWAENSAISLELFEALKQRHPSLPHVAKHSRFPLSPSSTAMATSKVISAVDIQWNNRLLSHYFLVVPSLPHDLYIGADIIVRLNACIDTLNDVIWAPPSHQLTASVNLKNLRSGQAMPDARAMINEQGVTIPAYSKSVSVRLNIKLAFFQPSRTCLRLGVTLEATPLIKVSSRTVYVLFNNCSASDINMPKASHLGWLINQSFHHFELMVPVGPIPAQPIADKFDETMTFTRPHETIAITSILPASKESVCRSELTEDTHLADYAVSTQPGPDQGPAETSTTEEPYAREADALHNGADRQGLKEVLHKYKDSFPPKDSLDCGLTNIHMVHIPTNPNDGCPYNHQGNLKVGAPTHNIKELLICTDSNYARLSFTCHLAGWKQNGFKTANNKPVKHQDFSQACGAIVTKHDMIVYWEKVRGYSRQPGQDKDLNNQTDALAKAGALHGEPWALQALPPSPALTVVTRHQHAPAAPPPPKLSSPLSCALLTSSLFNHRIQHYALLLLTSLTHPQTQSLPPPSSAPSTPLSTCCIYTMTFSHKSLSPILRHG